MEFTKLRGQSIKDDVEIIRSIFESGKKEMVYVLTNPDPKTKLYAYIDALKDNGISNKIMFDLKICYERQNLQLSFIADNSASEEKISSITELLGRLDGSPSSIIIDDNNRGTLAEVAQQLVFIGYPLVSVNIMLRKEAKDAQKTKRFMKKIDQISKSIDDAIMNIDDLLRKWENINVPVEEKQTLLNIISDARQRCLVIREKVERAKRVEMKIAVAAIKKTGKSVIVNSMIQEELAPTSLMLATPNNCIYRKSVDNKYHLTYNGKRTDYSAADDIHKVIGREFKKAQEDIQNNLCIPDMEIEYVTDGNNFDTFTVYDTPGPGLAGAAHEEAAYKAMKDCDVAVFAIDYSKYLTEDEIKYLEDIKKHFNQNQKFASLIFAVNKMDMRFDDPYAAKSVVYAVDLIRHKLSAIDDMYKDCIIFATSSLQYYNTIDCEKHCEDFAKSSNLIKDIKPLLSEQPEDSVVLEEMSKLSSIITSYEMVIRKDTVTSDDLKKYSGVPDLLNYAAYICQSKARDEIVNNITVTIDANNKALKAISDRIANIDILIERDQKQIEDIKLIIAKFYDSVKDILGERIYRSEITPINEGADKYANILHFMGDRESADFSDLEEKMKSLILDKYNSDSKTRDKAIDFIEYLSFVSLENSLANKMDEKELIEESKINKVMDEVYSSRTVSKYIKSFVEEEIREGDKETKPRITALSQELTDLIKERISTIKLESEKCSKELEKLDITLAIPGLPDFDFKMPAYTVNSIDYDNMDIEINAESMKQLFVGKKLNFLSQFWRNLHDLSFRNRYFKVKDISLEDYRTEFRRMKADMEDAMDKVDICNILRKENNKLGDILKGAMEDIREDFSQFLGIMKTCVEGFSSLVDDTEKHRNNIEAHNREKNLISELDDCFSSFLSLWDSILQVIGTREANQ